MLERFRFSLSGVIFGAVGLGISIWGAIVLTNAKASGSWPSVPGKVTESRVVSKTSRDSDGHSDTTYSAHVVYRYEVENAEYTCDTVSFGEYGTNTPKHAREIVVRYPKGKEVTVHYEPEKPTKAVLEPGVTWSSYAVLGFGLIFVGVGGSCFFSRR